MTAGAPSAAAPRRLLLVRTSALGDIVHALPTLTALRRAFPTARIGWVVDESFAGLLAGHESIDELLVVPLRRWRAGGRGRARELGGFLRRLRGFRADVALDLMGNHKAGLLALASGAPRRIGLRRGDRREPSSALWLTEAVPPRGAHAVERMLSTLAPLGLESPGIDFAPEALACGRGDGPPGPYVYLHPGAAWGNKRYPAAHWGAVAALVAARREVEVLVGAGPGEEDLAEVAVAASAGAARRHDARTLEELARVVRGARVVAAGDTGALHLAAALGRAVVAVHGPTDPERHGPWSAPDAVLVHRLPCSFCHRRMEEAKSCLLAIPPHAVAEQILVRLGPAVD